MHSPKRIDSTLLIIAATAITTLAGGLLGSSIALATWDVGVARATGGFNAGAAAGLVVGFVMAWHGSAISNSPGRAVGAAIWAMIPAALIGLSVAPVLSGAVGYAAYGQLGGGIMIGLLLGPLLGVAGWELAYWGDLIANRFAVRSR